MKNWIYSIFPFFFSNILRTDSSVINNKFKESQDMKPVSYLIAYFTKNVEAGNRPSISV